MIEAFFALCYVYLALHASMGEALADPHTNSDSAGSAYWEVNPGESLPHERVVVEDSWAGQRPSTNQVGRQ